MGDRNKKKEADKMNEMQALIEVLKGCGVNVNIDTSKEEYTGVSADFTEHDKEYLDEIDRLKYEIEKLSTENEELKVENVLPSEPIEVAYMLISATSIYKSSVPKVFGLPSVRYRIYKVSDLKQIAKHLLLFCKKHQGEDLYK